MNEGKPMGERMAYVESWVTGHEKLCADRYRLLMAVIALGATALVSVAGWGLNRVHDDQRAQIQELRSLASQIQNVKAPPVNVQMNPAPDPNSP